MHEIAAISTFLVIVAVCSIVAMNGRVAGWIVNEKKTTISASTKMKK
jgi:hypothetical protein